jgi:hypothetical protein
MPNSLGIEALTVEKASAPTGPCSESPRLEGDAQAAIHHRGIHLQVIASAGSGKTKVASQRVADLLTGGRPASAIAAFTFTERDHDEEAFLTLLRQYACPRGIEARPPRQEGTDGRGW